ncbi:GNAT family N-acetyltransferase [Catenovulum sp. 2E275]|uniref:GNAT family N-acetyltransferase n=1 Tax=Catenovulum sp. 2E275 TaxID=2980497 RepID=UPI0021D0341A|nr:GNAT family N-acetyltransferase [Catenovulum sp. 2E275]MCU4674669.1 GNAT family N-acetyltransferase [Catenovulum sp. 2E275]
MIREAQLSDIPDFIRIRQQPSDNPLNPSKPIPLLCYQQYLTKYGKGWVYTDNNGICGYVIGSKKESTIWALFIAPEYQGKGIGKALLKTATNWLNENGIQKIYLSTAVNSKAEHFYQHLGWHRGIPLETGQVTYTYPI